ncbi:MAG: hypothetical protein K0R98_1263 [Rickettsiaceae bacterium]|jgi:hypothetical protein|nr:hypothetical protein [Rickettsiaceae bacterium]
MKKISSLILASTILISCTQQGAIQSLQKQEGAVKLTGGPNCANKHEMEALDSRSLQTLLMVAALSCGKQKNYNEFMNQYKKEITSKTKDLEGYFKRTYKDKSKDQLNKFITALANAASKQSLSIDESRFCKSADDVFASLKPKASDNLIKVSANDQFSSLHGVRSCN